MTPDVVARDFFPRGLFRERVCGQVQSGAHCEQGEPESFSHQKLLFLAGKA